MFIQDLIVLAVIILALDAVFLYAAKDLFARQVMLVQGTAIKVNIPSAVVAAYYCSKRNISCRRNPNHATR
jgi:hypothetical protein